MADANIRAVVTAEDRASAVLKGFGDTLKAVGQITASFYAVDKIIGFGAEFVNAFNEANKATTELNSVIQSTGDISGVTAKQAEDLATSLSQVTTFSKTTTLAAEDVLLRFTNIGQSIFPQVVKSTQDLATGLGTDLSSAAAIVGRALDAPANASRSLRSAQIVLNSTQQETIKHFVDAGQGAQAQGYILDILKTKFGGLATAVGQTFGGQLQILQNNLEIVRERMGEVLANGLAPLVDGITNFVEKNQSLIVSVGLATLAGVGFATVVVGIAGAIALADAALIPYIAAFVVLATLVGGFVFNAVQKMQQAMGATTKSVKDGSKTIATDGANNFGEAGKAASDLAKKLADIKTQMDQTTADFLQSLAQIVKNHEQSVVDIKRQIDDETKAFTQAQLSQSQAHAQKVRELESQIKALEIVNAKADEQRLNDLRVSLAQENESYQQNVADATDAHQAKLTDFQTKLQAETDFLNKHNADVQQIQNVQILDEIDKLKQSHDRQMAAFAAQTQAAIDSSNSQIASAAAANAGVSAQTADMQNNLKHSYNLMQNDFKQYFIAPIQDAWDKIVAYFKGSGTGKESPYFQLGYWLETTFAHLGHNAQGTDNWTGGPTWVGENGPEIINAPAGSQIIPNNKLGSAGGSVNITIQAQAFMGNPSEARSFAKLIGDHLKDVASVKNMSVSEMLG